MSRVPYIILAALVQIFSVFANDFPIVHTNLGDIRGNVAKTFLDKRDFYSFRGIRYAQPPVGELRFKVSMEQICCKDLFLSIAISRHL